jgi:hypothetical protein
MMWIPSAALRWRSFAVRIPNQNSWFAGLFIRSVIDSGYTAETCREHRI